MATRSEQLFRHIRRLVSRPASPLDADAALLGRFIRHHDQDAFAALVHRHGPLVFGVCRRVLGDAHEAEDAAQAVFLVLARKAATIRPPDRLAAWLHGVARHLAWNAHRAKVRRRRQEVRHAGEARERPPADPLDELTARELLNILDEELQRLPEVYRLPVILSCLEGRSLEQAAAQLGWTPGSVKGRLERGREKLRRRLIRRGVTLSTGLMATLLTQTTASGLPSGVIAETACLAVSFAGGQSAEVAASVAGLAKGVLADLLLRRLKIAALVVLLGFTTAGTGAWMYTKMAVSIEPARAEEPLAQTPAPEPPKVEVPKAAPVDRFGDPLPPHAVARFGTVRFRHIWTIFASAISPDGRLLAGASGQSVQIWDAETGRSLQRWSFPGFRSFVLALAFTPDGRNLASYEEDEARTGNKGQFDCIGKLRFTDVATGKTVRQFDCAKYRAPSRSRDLSYLAVLSGGKQVLLRDPRESIVRLFDARNGEEIQSFRCAGDRLHSFTNSPDGQLLAVGEQTGTVRLWEVASGKERFALKKHAASCIGLTFSPDSKTLASGDKNGVAHLWDVTTGNIVHTLDPKIDQGPGEHLGIGSLSFAPDGKSLLSSHRYRVVFWDASTGKEIRRLPNEPTRALRYLPDGKTLVAGGDNHWGRGDNMFRFFDSETGKPCRNFDGLGASVCALAYSADGKYIAACDGGNTAPPELRVWEVSSGRVVLQNITRDTWHMTSLAFSPKGDMLAAAHWNNITLWDLKTGKPRRTLPNYQAAPSGSLAFSTDGAKLACAGQDDSIRVWDLAGEKELRNIHVGVKASHPPFVREVSFSPDLRFAAYGDWEAGSIRFWNLSTGKVWKNIKRGGVGLLNVAFSPDGRTLLEASEGGKKMFLWEVASGQLRRAVPLSSFPHWDVAYSPDGRRIAVAQDSAGMRSADKPPSIWLFDLASNRPPAKLFGHKGVVNVLKFSPDSRILASGSNDTTALLWDVAGLDLGMTTAPLTQGQRATCWDDLAGDAERAYDAIWKLVNDTGSLELLREKVKPAPAPADAKLVGQLLADLNSDQFPVRSRAQEQLAKLGTAAEDALRNALAGKTTLELRKRVEMLLAAIESERLRTRRAIETLELINTASARKLLQTLSNGPAGAWLTLEAQESLGRLSLRPAR